MSARFGLNAVLGFVLGIALLALFPFGSAWSQSEKRPVLLLLPVRVHSSENPTYLQEGLMDMLQARFRQGGVFELRQIADPSRSTTDLAEAVAAARDENADFVLFGSFTRFGAGASLDMQAATTALGGSGESMREIFVHSGSIAEVIPDLDELVGKVTQFAKADPVTARASSNNPAAGEPKTASQVEQLQKRVEALEAQLGSLSSQPAQ